MEIFYAILVNVVALIICYFIGSVNVSIIFSRKKRNEDIRNKGSFNAGSTNALRVYGSKVALPIFIFDILKAYIAIIIVWLVHHYTKDSVLAFSFLIPQAAGLGIIIGHIWPIFFNFKGGKGAASLLGLFFGFNLVIVLIGIIIFVLLVYFTRYISLGSIVVPFILIALGFIPWFSIGHISWFNWKEIEYLYWLNPLFILISHIFVVYSHRSNIKRLINKNENKFKFKK
ncbi:glycerol-3-phosphate 1-O-acyltransferase PlsY [Mesomycoplasma lagogenitalium]|uniref:Glycerol-3-phosphate acyltransferase n=1 Tax=Mesomycoplasma lagogenitalium TaxID=171286 RepID=A0ABY8LVM1_9BACT|nr:glycerol-3-phosphate 1-O-acyltransferase PlsY [Mesomycoplasma lagogenitalium]WGI36333.1 glycerol-3-phosphate 1-O-acyltransferase PlsY [Mesomycoplasma lagogenitalium]